VKNNLWWLKNDAYARKSFLNYILNFLKSSVTVNCDYAILKGPKELLLLEKELQNTYESEFLSKIKNLEINGPCIDIGSWIGHIAILLAKKSPKVYAIEPDKRNIKYLKHNLKKNHISNIQIFENVIDEHNGFSRFVIAPNCSGNSIYATGFTVVKKSYNLETFLEKINESKIDLIKMDVQGAEYPIITTASSQVFEKIDKWLIECHSEDQSENKNLIEILKKNGYDVELFGHDGIHSEIHLFAKKI